MLVQVRLPLPPYPVDCLPPNPSAKPGTQYLAGLAEWQTRQAQTLLSFVTWGFKSLTPYQEVDR